MEVQHVCEGVSLILQGTWFFLDFLVLLLISYRAILGIQWLSTLGNIQWNFKTMEMQFEYLNQYFYLKGNSPIVFLKQDAKVVQKAFQSTTSLFLSWLPQINSFPTFYWWFISMA